MFCKRNNKLYRLSILGKNNSGIILIVVLWALVILTTIALSLGRRTHIDTSLASHFIGRTKARYYAWAGIIYAMDLIRRDSKDADSKNEDTLYRCGISNSIQGSVNNLFKEKVIGDGFFSIVNDAHFIKKDIPERIYDLSSIDPLYGFKDEERLININSINSRNVSVLRRLILLLGEDEETADIIAYSILDWIDKDRVKSHESYGAEKDYYQALEKPYLCKNLPFDSLLELLLVRGVTQEIYYKLKNYVTIYPKKSKLKVNFDTASEIVLKALALTFVGAGHMANIEDVDSLVSKMISYREGEDNKEFTADDRMIEYKELPLNQDEKNLFLRLNKYRVKKSAYFKIKVKGTDKNRKISAYVETIIRRGDLSIVSWRRF